MGQDIFLARTEEQRQFRRSLSALTTTRSTWAQRQLPTFTKLLPRPEPPEPEPRFLLFYGPGGMGKTTLTKRLHALAQKDAAFRGKVNILFLDWEQEQKLTVDLQVGHDNIAPDTVLKVFHKALVKAGWGKCFGEYETALKALAAAETKVNQAMQGQPDNTLPDQVSRLGAKGVAFLLRLNPVTSAAVSQEALETTLDSTFKVSAEGLHQTRQFVRQALTPQEYELYEQPNERLAEALGAGLARLSQQKPLVLLFDTYEIVDRPECDYTLRRVMDTSGDQTLWAIAGRSNLADSGQRGRVYFRGYKRDFAEGQLYDRALSEFGLDLIQQYFAQVTPDRPITEAQADAVARFSLGIPFVIRQAAVMWREGKPIEDIVAPTATTPLGSGLSAYDQVIKTTSERFLVHCFEAPGKAADLEAIYALALMRRPDAELLRQMLDEPDLEGRLQQLKQRYAFIWVEQVRLDEKLTQFLRAYLLADVRRTSARVQTLNDRAIAWLELQCEAQAQGIADTAEQFQETTLAELWLDLAHHQFWRSEEAGMRYLVPHFVLGWQYDRAWTRSLLEIAESFQGCLGKGYRQRLSQFEAVLDTVFYPDPDAWQAALTDLGKLKQRDWLAGDNPAELQTILAMRQGQLAYRLEKYHSALRMYLASEQTLPPVASRLRQDLAANFYRVSNEFIWPDKDTSLVFSLEGEQAAEKAVALDPNRSEHQYNLGVIRSNGGRLYEAISAYQQAIKLECKSAHPHNGLGNVYAQQGRYDEAITAYQEAISLDQRDAAPHNGLGNVYRAQGRYDEAISAYQQAIKLEHKLADPYNGLGSVYRNQGHYDEAITTYRQAIKLDPKYAVPNANLGEVHLLKSCFSEAEKLFLKALKMKGEDYYELFYLGLAQALQGKPNAALENWQKSLSLATDTSPPARLNRCLIQLALASSPTAIEQFAATIQHYQSSQGLLKEALETAQLLARCPQPPAKIDQAIALLQAALEPPSS